MSTRMSAAWSPPGATGSTTRRLRTRRPSRSWCSTRRVPRASGLAEARDEVLQHRIDAAAPLGSAEDAVVAGAGLDVGRLHLIRQAGEQGVRGGGLARRTDVVEVAFDGQQG